MIDEKKAIRREKDGKILPYTKTTAKKPGFTVVSYPTKEEAATPVLMEATIDEVAIASKSAGALTREGLREEIEKAETKEEIGKLGKKYGIENIDKRKGIESIRKSVVKLVNKLPGELFK